MRIIALAGLAFLLAACAIVGSKFDPSRVNDVQKGQEKEQIRAWFGGPHRVTQIQGHPAGCVERWQWTYARAVGFGHVTESRALIVDFGKDGKVCDSAYSQL